MNLEQLRAKYKEIAAAMVAILEGDENLTDEQAAQFDTLDVEGKDVDKQIKALEAAGNRKTRLAAHTARLAEPRPSVAQKALTDPGPIPTRAAGDPAVKEFASNAEAWAAYAEHIDGGDDDPRLLDLYQGRGKKGGFLMPGLRAENQMGVGADGGFAVPVQFSPTLYQTPVSMPIVRPRALVIPAGDPPDAEFGMPAIDQTSNIHGGVTVEWFGEGADLPETDLDIRPIVLKPQQVGAFIVVTNKLLSNWAAAGALLPLMLRNAINSEEDFQFIQGDGVAKPQGFIGHASSIAVARKTGNRIEYDDLVLMESRLITNAVPAWLTSRRYSEQLRRLQSPEGHLIWGDGLANDQRPPTLLGYPVVYAPRFPALGTEGDIVLTDLRNYGIKDGSPILVASSEHVEFKKNKTVIKAVWSVDGQPLTNLPIKDEDTLEYSAFVTIAA